ncbi:glycosyltransferase family A protein [uncultured Muribaculum sp.]|uniref:glycosyltransferase family A protein n=1 Tax=uncultured Muribaculum sp. TaxID=1918613 RepID=UPI0025DE6D72|nr:glycosyltransferase family A protein [uncultured Muribaculum sp.]
MVKLQVMICTYDADGIKRTAKSLHPSVPEVEYLIGWQTGDNDCAIPEELKRPDFKIFPHATKGLSKNRNYLLSKATAPILLVSDDDVDYTVPQLKSVIDTFEANPDYDIIAFRYNSAFCGKNYPDSSFNLWNPPKGYYVSSIEIGIRNGNYLSSLKFNKYFGCGSGTFIAGEEDIFLNDCKKLNLRAIYFPHTICTHNAGETTSERNQYNPCYIQTKGAVFIYIHPLSWPLRMLAHAVREKNIPRYNYIANWIKGAFKALRLQVKSN